jgi:hypothetical protein
MASEKSTEHAGSAAIVIVVGAVSLVLASPGALLVFAVEHIFSVSLDVEQRWTFSIVASIVVWVALRIRSAAGEAFTRYVWCAALTTAVTLVARFGLHAAWPAQLWASFFG